MSKKIEDIINSSINKFDRPIDDLIKELKQKRDQHYTDFSYWNDLETTDPNRYEGFDEIANQTGHSLQIQMRENIESALYVEDELLALLEMKIIYAFKHLEINLKKLLSYAYYEFPRSKPKWYEMEEFLKKKDINVKDISGYSEVNELRLVNNSLKHSHQSIDRSIMPIQEFQNGSIQNFDSLENFYSRIEDDPSQFFCALIEKVEKEINDFNENKLSKIAKNATYRMNNEIAEKLIIEIKNIYK